MKISEMFEGPNSSLKKAFDNAVDPFEDDAPAVSKKLTIHKASDDIGCQSCSA